jgi:hypothetical protein
MMIEGMNRDAALRTLAAWDGPTCEPVSSEEDTRTLAEAHAIWESAQSIFDSAIALRYLKNVRHLDVDALPNDHAALRFHPKCPVGTRGGKLPCLIACYRDVLSDEFAGIHRVLLSDDVIFFSAKPRRYTLGRWPAPRAIKLWPALDEHLFVGEGLETTLAAATRFDYFNAPILPAWAAGSGSNLARLPVLPNIKKLILLVDHDANGEGEKSANACSRVWHQAGREVDRLRPPQVGMDFNDMLLALEHAS